MSHVTLGKEHSRQEALNISVNIRVPDVGKTALSRLAKWQSKNRIAR